MMTLNTYNRNLLTIGLGMFGAATTGVVLVQNYGISGFEHYNNAAYYSSQSMRYEASPIRVVDAKVQHFFDLYPEVRDALNKLDDVTVQVFGSFESHFEAITDWDTGKMLLVWYISTGFDVADVLAEKESAFFNFIDQEKLAEQLLDVVIYIS